MLQLEQRLRVVKQAATLPSLSLSTVGTARKQNWTDFLCVFLADPSRYADHNRIPKTTLTGPRGGTKAEGK